MRAAVIDIGTNSTRLLIADVSPSGVISELVRRSVVTRLGAGVDAAGTLSSEARERVCAALADFRREIDAHTPDGAAPSPRPAEGAAGERLPAGVGRPVPYPNLAVMTSAVREARNGATFAATVRSRFSLDARVLSGDQEARMTFLGAMSGRSHGDSPGDSRGDSPGEGGDPAAREPAVVVDIGGGSTEFILGAGSRAGFHVSLPAGVVRMSERHIHSDPPDPAELRALADDVRALFRTGLPAAERTAATRGIAVAGTATSAAAIDQELDPYDPARVHGYPLSLATVELLLARLATMSEPERRAVVGLHPDRAPTIVAGMILLSEAMRLFDLDRVTVSEHDILHGGLLTLTRTIRSDM